MADGFMQTQWLSYRSKFLAEWYKNGLNSKKKDPRRNRGRLPKLTAYEKKLN